MAAAAAGQQSQGEGDSDIEEAAARGPPKRVHFEGDSPPFFADFQEGELSLQTLTSSDGGS